ncbi:uncharacterized protein ASCRUDRAFT_77061 [Ascoidea rubescens DSM 1968]|uniref:Phosphatases II n=1 Tax=Ascoidea rubescens DSM 1968 TaxID=1344418 RepID=A0A1D2VDK6_9ASCO|nr:hypothetical protein ASCRUDRAFT_77061 [Ascoidea rubescens DSM 1968]ODV59721.1 hypothetical protein ASCRUDRAFT_77061 [Ascoidea rubescens DSM 1968]
MIYKESFPFFDSSIEPIVILLTLDNNDTYNSYGNYKYWPTNPNDYILIDNIDNNRKVSKYKLKIKNINVKYFESGKFYHSRLLVVPITDGGVNDNNDNSDIFIDNEFNLSSFGLNNQKPYAKIVNHIYYNPSEFNDNKSFLELVKYIENLNTSNKISKVKLPLFISCINGIGSTGLFISLHYLLNYCGYFKIDNLIDIINMNRILNHNESNNEDIDIIFNFICELRNQRLLLVENVSQFLFIYSNLRNILLERIDFFKRNFECVQRELFDVWGKQEKKLV